MELVFRLLMYIFMANVGYMIFSLFQKGYRHYSGYIAQLFLLLVLMITLLVRDIDGITSVLVSLSGIVLLVFLPIFLQRQIDVLMAESRYAEIEPYARWKANIAWSEMNAHLHEIALLVEAFFDDQQKLELEIRKIMNRGEPYDSMTRVFLGLIHFNNRNFLGMINDLRLPDKTLDEQSFEELLYLVRAYLETTGYKEAVEAQLALERKMSDPEDFSPEKRANLIISRMILFAMAGWIEEFSKLMQSAEEGIERLPLPLRDFWYGVCLFNSGDYENGEKKMAEVIKESSADEENEAWLPFMRKRFFSLLENREFFDRRILMHLQELRAFYAENALPEDRIDTGLAESNAAGATNALFWVTMIVSVILMMTMNIEDVLNLVHAGANSSYLVKNGEYFRLLTYQFVHIGWVHLTMNLLALKLFGPPIESITGWPLFIGLYFFSGLAGGGMAVYAGQPLSAGASAAVLGLLSAAIIFEFFKAGGSEKLANRNNFSTLIFILVINLIIGAVEKGVDNSAHLGGLIGGAVLSLVLLPVLRSHLLKKAAGIFSVWACVMLFVAAIWQFYGYHNQKAYPELTKSSMMVSDLTGDFKLSIPDSWKIEDSVRQSGKIEAIGPFREGLSAVCIENEFAPEKFLKEYMAQRTKELEQSENVQLISSRGPEKVYDERPVFNIRWQMQASGGPLSVVDFLVFKEKKLIILRFYLGTQNTDAYHLIMNSVLNSLQINS